jgi:hypothetical protein
MQQLDDLNRRFGNRTKGTSIKNNQLMVTSPSPQESLDEIGGEPLVGSGFESEEPESGFSHAREGS